MVEIKEVKSKADYRKFVDFPAALYKGEKNYVPFIRMDELALRNPEKNALGAEVDSTFFLAYRDGKIAGRIAALVHKQRNALAGEKRVRFSRFDCVNDVEVARALFNAVETLAKNLGMVEVHGPMGYSDMDKEGMLVEGFDRMGTFVAMYNYDYFPNLMEACGYKKDVDWVEYILKMPDQAYIDRVKSLGERLMSKFKLHFATGKNKKDFLDKYAGKFFEIINSSYADLYGVIPHNDKTMKQMVDSVNLLIRQDFICVLLDENENSVGCALVFPAIGEILRDSKGRLTPAAIIKLLKFAKKPTKVELGLIGVMPQYMGKGINAILISRMLDVITSLGITEVESNPELEHNEKVQSQWDALDKEQHKRRRVYIKKI